MQQPRSGRLANYRAVLEKPRQNAVIGDFEECSAHGWAH
jgi:hypothetical protein